MICAVYLLQSLTGLPQPFLKGHNAKTKATFRIEKVSGINETAGREADPTGQNWAWCS